MVLLKTFSYMDRIQYSIKQQNVKELTPQAVCQ